MSGKTVFFKYTSMFVIKFKYMCVFITGICSCLFIYCFIHKVFEIAYTATFIFFKESI